MKNLRTLVKSAAIACVATGAILAATTPANALAKYTFEFQDVDGNSANDHSSSSGEFVKGEITFDNLTPGSIIDGFYNADTIVVTEIPSTMESIWGDSEGLKLNANLLGLAGTSNTNNNFRIINEDILVADLRIEHSLERETIALTVDNFEGVYDGPSEIIAEGLDEFGGILTLNAGDTDSSSLTFAAASTSAAVPFEFSPSLGLLLVGGVFGINRYLKSRQAKKAIENS